MTDPRQHPDPLYVEADDPPPVQMPGPDPRWHPRSRLCPVCAEEIGIIRADPDEPRTRLLANALPRLRVFSRPWGCVGAVLVSLAVWVLFIASVAAVVATSRAAGTVLEVGSASSASSGAFRLLGTPHAEVRVSQRSEMIVRTPVAGKPVTKAPWTRSQSRDWRNPEKASPAEFDLATGGRKLGGGAPSCPVIVTGLSTWYRWHPNEAAAGPALRKALGSKWRGTWVVVTAGEHLDAIDRRLTALEGLLDTARAFVTARGPARTPSEHALRFAVFALLPIGGRDDVAQAGIDEQAAVAAKAAVDPEYRRMLMEDGSAHSEHEL